jgi:glyoxylase-like metal-dependent hydrolase (beta-lactamase superfamily II)
MADALASGASVRKDVGVQVPPRPLLELGDFRVDHVVDGVGRFLPTRTFAGSTDAQWATHRALLDADGRLPITMGGFLVRGLGRTVLIDAGYGQGEFMGITNGALLDNLRRLGVAPHEVTDLVFTHLHIDHIGWASADGEVVFQNATYRCAPADWEHFMVLNPGAEAERLEPASDRFERWQGEATILPGLDTMSTPGHTPGSTTLILSSGDDRLMFLGDVVHCPVQLEDDEWAALFDVDPVLAKRTRNALARELEGTNVRVSGAHFPEMSFGRLVRAEGRRRFVI